MEKIKGTLAKQYLKAAIYSLSAERIRMARGIFVVRQEISTNNVTKIAITWLKQQLS